ncbi:MAG: AAA family ATPase [Mogibacterium sp.]|nr:AAA family ATPase [Mogibacterium sp.]
MNNEITKLIENFRNDYPCDEAVASRVIEPYVEFIGDEIVEQAARVLLLGENLLLSGPKATGKNILAENLAWMFGRPVYTVSFNANTDSSALIGTDTFRGGEVSLRPGVVSEAAKNGGFCILDEINMAKNDAVAVLHSVLDYRRLIDVPGYDMIKMHPAARFIATMNYGYAGTRELNEALVSRFSVIQMPALSDDKLATLLKREAPGASEAELKNCVGLFMDLHEKAVNGEISPNAVDLRGLISALRLCENGMAAKDAVTLCITNKCFDDYEHTLVDDIVMSRFA